MDPCIRSLEEFFFYTHGPDLNFLIVSLSQAHFNI